MCFLFHFIWVRRQQREDSMESLSVRSLIMVWFSDVGPILVFKEIRVSLSQLVARESFLCHRDSWPAIISIPEEGLPVSPVSSTPILPSLPCTRLILWHSLTGLIHSTRA